MKQEDSFLPFAWHLLSHPGQSCCARMPGWLVLRVPVTTAPRLPPEPGPCHPACVPHVRRVKGSALPGSVLATFCPPPPLFSCGLSNGSSGHDPLSSRASVSTAAPRAALHLRLQRPAASSSSTCPSAHIHSKGFLVSDHLICPVTSLPAAQKKVPKRNKTRKGVGGYQVSNISLRVCQHVTALARQLQCFCNGIQQKLIFQNKIRAKYHKLTATDTKELLIYKIIPFFQPT